MAQRRNYLDDGDFSKPVILGFLISIFIYWLLKLNIRFRNSFPFLCSLPSLGTCSLLIGRALCYPGGMLDGDPNCPNILGFMMMNSLVFQIILFSIGFIAIPKDASFSYTLMEKCSYLWHNLIPKVFDKNYSVNYILSKFMKDEQAAKKLFDIFESKYKLEM